MKENKIAFENALNKDDGKGVASISYLPRIELNKKAYYAFDGKLKAFIPKLIARIGGDLYLGIITPDDKNVRMARYYGLNTFASVEDYMAYVRGEDYRKAIYLKGELNSEIEEYLEKEGHIAEMYSNGFKVNCWYWSSTNNRPRANDRLIRGMYLDESGWHIYFAESTTKYYKTAEDCVKDNMVEIVDFDMEDDVLEAEEKKKDRIAELESIIENASRELAKAKE